MGNLHPLIYMFIKKRMALETEFWVNIQRDSRLAVFWLLLYSCYLLIHHAGNHSVSREEKLYMTTRKTIGGH